MSTFIDDLAKLIDQGGFVIIPLLAMSAISLALVVERCIFWASSHGPGQLKRLRKLHDSFRSGDRQGAARLTKGNSSPYGVVARDLLRKGANDAVAMESIEHERPRLERFMVPLSTIITAAPLLGILGTVIGIIRSFRLLGAQNTLTDPREVSAGIAEALLTTALGLIVALLTLFPYMVFRSQVGRSLGRLESLVAAAQQGEAERTTTPVDARRTTPTDSPSGQQPSRAELTSKPAAVKRS